MASVASAPNKHGEKAYFPDEPSGPELKTEIPGPKSKELISELTEVFDTRALNLMGDYGSSKGN
jgi:4-aminobutyrate aminotransferase/(S)-3-amino-2-methylpropionate transaminase